MTPDGLTAVVASRLSVRTGPVGDRDRGARHARLPSLQPPALIAAAGAVVIA